jgi:hypothetical protein
VQQAEQPHVEVDPRFGSGENIPHE